MRISETSLSILLKVSLIISKSKFDLFSSKSITPFFNNCVCASIISNCFAQKVLSEHIFLISFKNISKLYL